MPNLIIDLEVDRVDLVDEGANSQAFIKLYKRKERQENMTFDEILAKLKPEHAEVVKQELAKAKAEVPENVAKELETLKADYQKVSEELQKMKNQTVQKSKEEQFEEILKQADPLVQEAFKSLKAQKEAAEETIRQLHEKAKHEEAVAKAKELKNLPVEEEKLVDIIKKIPDEIYEILKAVNAAMDNASIFKEIGKSGEEAISTVAKSSDAAWEKIEKAAKELAARENITKEAAVMRVVKEYPELYREYVMGGAN